MVPASEGGSRVTAWHGAVEGRGGTGSLESRGAAESTPGRGGVVIGGDEVRFGGRWRPTGVRPVRQHHRGITASTRGYPVRPLRIGQSPAAQGMDGK